MNTDCTARWAASGCCCLRLIRGSLAFPLAVQLRLESIAVARRAEVVEWAADARRWVVGELDGGPLAGVGAAVDRRGAVGGELGTTWELKSSFGGGKYPVES